MRGLDIDFIKDLKEGILKDFLQAVKDDDTLCLEIRDNKLNIYYRGGNMFEIFKDRSKYKVYFNLEYCNKKDSSKYKDILKNLRDDDYKGWIDNIPFIKYEMDTWFCKHPKLEREYQQLILRENNYSKIANDTDYYICDIEYADSENKSRFDIVGIKWLSKSQARKKSSVGLAFIEMKYGDAAVKGDSGIKKHINDIYGFVNEPQKMDTIYKEIEDIFNQKVELGLISGIDKNISINNEIKPEFIFFFANHKPAKSILESELKSIIQSHEYKELSEIASVKIAKASYMGYGLYDECIVSLEEFLNGNKDSLG